MSCARTSFEISAGGAREEQTHVLKLKPFMVDMLDVIAVEGPAGGVECWMDIQKGVFPNVSLLGNNVFVNSLEGPALTFIFFLDFSSREFNKDW